MGPIELYKSVFAILRIDNRLKENNAKIVGTGFVINTDPIHILTCNHVVGEGTENNDKDISYSIVKRSDNIENFDLRSFTITHLKAKKIYHKPGIDLAILEIDPAINRRVSEKILKDIKHLELNFNKDIVKIGLPVEWISVGTLGELTLVPRFFRGNIVAKYIRDNQYKFINPQGKEQLQIMKDINIFEVDQLFLNGCSGSPIISSEDKKIIGWVHGFNAWPLPTVNIINQKVQIIENSIAKDVNIKSNLVMGASLSLGIEAYNAKDFLIKNNFIKN